MSGEHRSKSYHALLKSYPDSRKLNSVSEGAENLYLRILAASDDRGRYWGEPTMVARKLYARRPLVTDAMVADRLAELERAGLVRRYIADGETCLEIAGLYRPLKSDRSAQVAFPAPVAFMDPTQIQPGSNLDPERIHSGSLVQGEGEGEGEGKGLGASAPARAARQPSFAKSEALAMLPAEHAAELGATWARWIEHVWARKRPTRTAVESHLASFCEVWEKRGAKAACDLLDGGIASNAQGIPHWAKERAMNGAGAPSRPTNGRRPHKSILDHLAEGTLILED